MQTYALKYLLKNNWTQKDFKGNVEDKFSSIEAVI